MMEAFIALRTCMLEQLEKPNQDSEQIFEGFTKITDYCVVNTDVSRVVLDSVKNYDETKYFIKNNTAKKPVVVVTLGVGNDIQAERELKKILPEGSEFFGADPVLIPNAELFKEIGMFFPFAVSGRTSIADAYILENSSYRYAPVVNIDAETFFTKLINRTSIDLLIMDNEDGEYEIVPQLAMENILEKAGMVVCQMNVEFHNPFASKMWRYKHFVDIMKGVLKTGRFAPIRNSDASHQRMFLVNYADPYCVQKYLNQFFAPSPNPEPEGLGLGEGAKNTTDEQEAIKLS